MNSKQFDFQHRVFGDQFELLHWPVGFRHGQEVGVYPAHVPHQVAPLLGSVRAVRALELGHLARLGTLEAVVARQRLPVGVHLAALVAGVPVFEATARATL